MKSLNGMQRVSLGLTAAVALALVGCGDKKPADDPSTANTNAMAAQQNQYGQQQGQYPQPQGPYGQPQGQYPQQPQGQYPQQQGQYPQQPQGQYPQQQVPAATGTVGAPATAPAAGTAAGQPAATTPQGTAFPTNPLDPNFLAQAAAAAGAMMQQPGGAAALGDPTEAGLKLSAAKNAPGMTADGQEAKQALTEGQHVSMGVSMQAGKCYTIIGFSPLGGVKDLDLTLLAPPFYNVSAGSDGTKDANPIIGKGNQPFCPIIPVPVQYKLDIFAKSGAGQVAVQVYSKTK